MPGKGELFGPHFTLILNNFCATKPIKLQLSVPQYLPNFYLESFSKKKNFFVITAIFEIMTSFWGLSACAWKVGNGDMCYLWPFQCFADVPQICNNTSNKGLSHYFSKKQLSLGQGKN